MATTKWILGLREGTTENSRVAKALLRDPLQRGLDAERARGGVVPQHLDAAAPLLRAEPQTIRHLS